MPQNLRRQTTSGARIAPPRALVPALPRLGDWQTVRLAAEGPSTLVYQSRPVNGSGSQPAAYALKVLTLQAASQPESVARLQREAALGRFVTHPHLLPVLAAHVSEPPYYFVTPWLEGQTVASQLSQGALEVPTALWIARQVAEALGSLHAHGWMHGDVKPANIFLSPHGHVTLLDLGFARRSDEACAPSRFIVMGTCEYLAPEVVTPAMKPDHRSDLYSLGIMLFEMIAGRLPFRGQDAASCVEAHCRECPPDLRGVAPRTPQPVARLVRELLAKEPLRRPQTSAEVSARLLRLEIDCFALREIA